MTNSGRRRVAFQLGVALTMLTAVLSTVLVLAGPAQAQVSSLPLQFSDVVIFGTNSVRTDNNAQVMAGHVVANTASPGPTLTSGFELALGKGTTTPAGYAIVGDSIQVGNNAVVGGNAFYNNLSNSGTINGTLNTPISLPVFSPLPEFHLAVPGTQDVAVGSNQTVTLAPGAYRDISVQNNGILRLGPGVYDVRSITMSGNSRMTFINLSSGKVDVRVLNQVTTNGVVASDDGDPLKAKKVIFYVAYASGANLTPAAVTLTGTFNANVYAPNGTVRLNDGVRATGAFLGRDIDVGSSARVDLETFFTQQAPAITSANATTFTVGQAGTFTVTTTGFPTPSITRGGAALPSGVNFVDNGDGTGTLSGTPAASTGGTYAITFTANNGVPPNAVQNFTLTVNQTPAITSANATTFTVGSAGSFTVTTTGFPAPSIARGGAALPAGVTFVDNGNGTGTLSGIPAAGTGGIYSITFTATNAAGSSPVQSFTLTVNQTPAITSANTVTFTVGQPGSFTVTTTGFPTPSIARGGVALPSGVNFVDNGNGTGTLSGTPAAGTGGSYAITFTATNVAGSSPVQNFTLNVNQAPTITSADNVTFTMGTNGSFTVMTTGFPAPSIARGGVALPSGVTFTDNGNGTGTLSGTPAPGTGGVYAITFTATNAAGSSPVQNFTLTVNEAPTITSANTVTFTVGQLGSFTVTTIGFPTPSIAQGGALPNGVNFVNNGNGTGTLSGTPAAGTGGVYPLTFTASNGNPPNAVQNFTLNVNEPPSAVADGPYVTDANTVLSRVAADLDDLLDNDVRGFPLATITSFGGGSLGGSVTSNAAGSTATFGTGGSLVVQSNGAFTFTPEANFTGTFTFQYRLTNSGGTSDATVTIQVRPKATSDIFGETVVGNVIVNTATGVVFSVLPNDVFNGPVSATLVSPFSTNGGAVTLNGSTGTFTYNPPVGFQGLDSFAYTITDGSGFTSAPATVAVTVSGMIWFVNNNGGACSSLCNGRLTNPFTTLDGFTGVNDGVGTHPGNNQNIFVYESATSYTFSTGTLLLTGQKLIGQDATATLVAITGVTVPTGSSLPAMNTGAPATTIGSTVALAASSTVRGLTVSTGASTGVSGGAVSGVTVSETIVTTTTGTAVNLNGTGGTLSFTSVSANGAANGIALTNTTGSFTVTGDSGSANNGSGGTIQNTTSHAVALNNAQNVSLDQMNVSGAGDSGVNGTGVTNFAFTNGTISNVGNAGFESAIAFNGSGTGVGNNIAGTLTVTGNTFVNPFYGGLDVQSNDGTVTSANVSNNTITNPGFSGIGIVGTGTATTVFNLNGATINQNNISSSGGHGIQVLIGNSTAAGPGATGGIPNDAANRIDITNNSVSLDATGTQAIVVSNTGGNSGSRTQTNFVIECNGRNTGGCTAPTANPISGSAGGTTVGIGNNGYATMVGVVNNNSIDANHTVAFAGNGIGGGNGVVGAGNAWTPDLSLTVTNNSITRTDGNGILLVGRGTSGTAKLKIANNSVTAPLGGVRPGIRVDAGNTASADDSVCLDISGNVSAGSGGSAGIGLRKQGTNPTTNDFGVEGMVATSSPGVETYVDGLNPAGGGTLLISATSGFSNCNTAP